MGLYARRGDILDIGRVDRYCTQRRSIAHRVQVSAVHRPCKAARVPPQPPWHRANPIATELLWPVVLSTQPGQLGWAHGWISPSSTRGLPSPPDVPQLGKVNHALGIVLDEGDQPENVVWRKVPRCPMRPQRFNEQQIQLRLAQAIIVGLPRKPRVTPGQSQDS